MAHNLSRKATMSQRVTKLRGHLKDAKKALTNHLIHVKKIKNLIQKADDD